MYDTMRLNKPVHVVALWCLQIARHFKQIFSQNYFTANRDENSVSSNFVLRSTESLLDVQHNDAVLYQLVDGCRDCLTLS